MHMGRMTEALSRTEAPARRSARGVGEGVFVSPWELEQRPVSPSGTADSTARLSVATPVEPFFNSPEADEAPMRRVARPTMLDRFTPDWKMCLAAGREPDPVLAEQFRRLAATLLHTQRADRLKSVMITSAVPAEGKTMTAINLALILSESYRRRVLLIDGDLRRPALSQAVNLSATEGLSDAIGSPDGHKVALVQLTEMLTLLPAGKPMADPLSEVSSPRMGRLLEEATGRFDWVIIDTPPLGAAADAGLICPLVDAALLVIRAGHTPHAAVKRAIDTLGHDRILGVVLNRTERTSSEEHAGYGYGGYQMQDSSQQDSNG
jgi:protein-tyrosine kinase